jgi:hypothetical protein
MSSSTSVVVTPLNKKPAPSALVRETLVVEVLPSFVNPQDSLIAIFYVIVKPDEKLSFCPNFPKWRRQKQRKPWFGRAIDKLRKKGAQGGIDETRRRGRKEERGKLGGAVPPGQEVC